MDDSGKAAAPSGRGEIRRLWPTERGLFSAHLLRLDAQTRRERFGNAVNDAFLEHYAETTLGIGDIVYAYVEDGQVRGAGELRGLEAVLPQTGEAAFSVEPAWRRRGIGEALFSRLITTGRNRGIGTLYLTCLPQNLAMRRLARKFEAELVRGPDDVEGAIATGRPTPFTILDEAIDNARGFATMALTLQRRFWRPAFLGRSARN